MGNFEDTKPKSKEEILKDVMEYLEESRFAFACFTDCFKRYLKSAGILNENSS